MGSAAPSDAKYISPNANFVALYQFSNQLEAQAANYAGLAADVYRQSKQFSSGYQLELSMEQIIDYNILQVPFYNKSIIQLLQLIIEQ